MIIVLSGGVGSGKSISAVRYAMDSDNVLANFSLKHHPKFTRLKREHIILENKSVPEGCRKPVVEKKVNWDFWRQHQNSDVFLDEIHNIMNSRTAMSKTNILMSEWLSQVRKLWGSSGDINMLKYLRKMPNKSFNKYFPYILHRSRNLWFVTQRPRKVDINVRDLCHVFIQCSKIEIIKDGQKHVVIINDVWLGTDNIDAIEMCEMGAKPKRCMFYANNYFKNYDSYEIIGMEGYL